MLAHGELLVNSVASGSSSGASARLSTMVNRLSPNNTRTVALRITPNGRQVRGEKRESFLGLAVLLERNTSNHRDET